MLLRLIVFLAGAIVVVLTLASAIRTFVLPRSARDPLSRVVFLLVRRVFGLFVNRAHSYEERDGVMALYAPVALLTLPVVWLAAVAVGYTGLYWAVGVDNPATAFKVSGSSLLTLGFATADGPLITLLAFSEAALGLILVALLIAYLPTMYTAFQRREQAVTLLEVRAGSPPSAVELLARYQRIHGLNHLTDLWITWEIWFADVEESHTSLAALIFFRSPQADHSWVTAAGAVLDAASLSVALLDRPPDPQANLCIRAGYLALRDIADFFRIPHNPTPAKDDPISISRAEFDAACAQLAAGGLPIKPDADTAWADFVGWRVNYDTVLLALAELTMAPYAPWSSDRNVPRRVKRDT
jgi:hypothetical protein